ncbi:MAG TPA: hypothetical protein VFP95_04595 [Gammaproteobacteria bacterium]|nr:hypothetical protein [Gammaproteobacteria bacterium]
MRLITWIKALIEPVIPEEHPASYTKAYLGGQHNKFLVCCVKPSNIMQPHCKKDHKLLIFQQIIG